MFDGSKEVAVGLRGAPAVRARTSASLIPLINSDSGTIAVSFVFVRSKYGPGAKVGEVVAFRLLYALALGKIESVIG